MKLLKRAMASALVLGLAMAARGTLVEEYFNGYGAVTQAMLYGLNGGSGWNGAWSNSASSLSPGYEPGVQMSFSFPGYSSAGNLSTANDGRGGVGQEF